MAADPKNPSQPLENKVDRAYLHDSVAELATSKTLSKDTLPSGKMSYVEGSPTMKIEHKGKIYFMPITNVKLMSCGK